jgi:alkylhydroperoxidase family enzyme
MMRDDLATAQAQAWERLAAPGTWWTGAERVAIAAETRHARNCAFCAQRAAALSPLAVAGAHDRLPASLPDAAIEAIHRIRTDSGRLGETWFLRLREAGLSEEAYVELVSVAAVVTAIDTFRNAAGLEPLALPAPIAGAPIRYRPQNARPGLCWVATLAPEDVTPDDPDLYREHPGPRERFGANIQRALSLVPHSMMHWWDLLEAMYQTSREMRDFTREYRAVTHAQIELLAARVSALNRCEY